MLNKLFKIAISVLLLTGGIWFLYLNSQKGEQREPDNEPVEEIARHELELTDQGLVYKTSKHPFTGKALEYHQDGTKSVSMSVVSGKVHGVTEAWHENGQLESREFFKSGLSEGIRTRWYETGQKRSHARTVAGKLDGEYTKWYPSGKIAQQATMIDGEAHGESKSWYEDGTLKSSVTLNHGKVVQARYYDALGVLKK